MDYIRHLDVKLNEHEKKFKEVLVLLGARQVGKTTILQKLFPQAQYLTVDNQTTKSILDRYDISAYRQLLLPSTKVLIVDEIHLLKDPGRAAKIFYDQIPEVKVIITGSSAFSIKNRATESLAGRKVDYHLFPLTISEYLTQTKIKEDLFFPILDQLSSGSFSTDKIYSFDIRSITDFAMLWGLYPAIISHSEKQVYLRNLVESVVFKDLLELSLIENRPAALNLLKLLANQIGGLVNLNELATKLQIDVKTVRRYINLFEQSFIIFSITPFSQSKRKEIGKMPKIYFYDCGLRNALVDNFQPINSRGDSGQLFENLIFSEVIKANYYGDFNYKIHYWRTTDGSEVDLVLEKEDKLFGIEIKSSPQRINSAFLNRYPYAKLFAINPQNYL